MPFPKANPGGKFPNVCFPWEEHFEKLHDGLVPVKFPNVFSSLGKKTFGKKNKNCTIDYPS
jgi:hypothetical protein